MSQTLRTRRDRALLWLASRILSRLANEVHPRAASEYMRASDVCHFAAKDLLP